MPIETRKKLVFSVLNLSLPVCTFILCLRGSPVWFYAAVYIVSGILLNIAALAGFSLAKRKQRSAPTQT